MSEKKTYLPLTDNQIKILESSGCTAQDWALVTVSSGFDASRVRAAHFSGQIAIGDLTGVVKNANGIEKPCGIYNAAIINCRVGDHTRIANIGVHIANYDIADGVCIENAGTIQTNPGATFGNGVEINVLNEAGGREVVLFNELSVQFAYILCLHRYRPALIEKLKAIAHNYTGSVKSDLGKIDSGTQICSTNEIIDVNIGTQATVNAASTLVNGTILSTQDAPTIVGNDVAANDFIIAESSSVTGGAVLDKVFIGQGCQIGKQYSAENSLFFANCEGFHGEACSIFAGPYTVSHHKSSLMIAGLFSFYNAGSGTNQSNHMYKLGPVHEGKLQRGSKTGSFSYMMWPCVAGPFSVILGKHTGTFDTADFPFSHLEARANGKCSMVPGLHLTTVGTVRDGAKWPNRDRRKGSVKRDIISFDVFSPFTVGKMIKANAILKNLQQSTDKSVEDVLVGGALVRRPILRTGQKHYRAAIEMYLTEKVVEKVEAALEASPVNLKNAFISAGNAVYSTEWVDIGGQLMAKKRLYDLEERIERGEIDTVAAVAGELEKIHQAYPIDEWLWIKNAYKQFFDVDLDNATKDDIANIAQTFLKARGKFFRLVAADAEKEFHELSRCGFGQDGSDDSIGEDFHQVRGRYEANKFVRDMKDNIEKLQQRIQCLEKSISKFF